jgi:D-3-phosphoglycerate dehydrogenase / 2-oxoglutarate reductase
MRILIADEFSKAHLDALAQLGLEVTFKPGAGADALPELARDAAILVVRSTEVKKAVFDAAHALSLVIRAGAGVNTIDVAAASGRGVFVANCPGQNAIAVAELTLGLLLAADRRIPDNVSALREGKWNKKEFSKAQGVYGRTLGVVGLGSIGLAVAARARAFGMRVVAHSRSLTAAKARALGFEHASDLVELAKQCDALSMHVPGGSPTKNLITASVLSALKDGAIFINTSRADVVDQAALLKEAQSGRLKVAADVFADEPKGGKAEWTSPLTALPNVYGTHHIGASTEQAQEAIADEAVRIVESFLNRGEVPNCVNIARRTPARYQLLVRHHDQVGVLANVLGELREAKINAQEIENTIFEGAAAACCKIQIDSRPADEVMKRIAARTNEVIFVDLVELKS